MLRSHQAPFPHTIVRGIQDPKLKSKEVQKILRKLCSGSVMTCFSVKKKPESRTFVVDLDSRQMTWTSKASQVEGSLNIREIKEIRPGKISKDFDRFQDDARKFDTKVCFSIFHGNEFNLKVLSIAGKVFEECDVWCRGISYLVIDTLTAPNPIQIKRYLQREFNQISKKYPKKVNDGAKFKCNLKYAKAWLPCINARGMSNSQVKSIFQEADSTKKNELDFSHFVEFYYELMHREQDKILSLVWQYSSDRLAFNAHDFGRFLRDEQKETWAQDVNAVKRFMNDYISDFSRRGDHVCFDKNEDEVRQYNSKFAFFAGSICRDCS